MAEHEGARRRQAAVTVETRPVRLAAAADVLNEDVVYGLFGPEDVRPRYVGRTTQPLRARLTNHLSEGRSGGHPLHAWIRGLDGPPVIRPLPFPTEREAITHYGISSLFNVAAGERGPRPLGVSPEAAALLLAGSAREAADATGQSVRTVRRRRRKLAERLARDRPPERAR